jgi:ribosomal protein L11 methyltransferase
MYLWRKRADKSWLVANEPALRLFAGNRLATIEQPSRKRIQLEVASRSQSALQKLRKQFGGRIDKLPYNWLKRFLRQQRTKPLRIAGKRLIIPAGAAFGTGEHATTAMCLRLLEHVMPGGRGGSPSRPSARSASAPYHVADLGTGSGILALAASLLGAKRVIGIDNDPVAISTAKENARRNKIDNVQFRVADVHRWKPPGQVEIITANLISELLIEILPKLRRVPVLILSGLLRDEEAEVARALQRHKIDIFEVRRRGKWVAILAGQLRRS